VILVAVLLNVVGFIASACSEPISHRVKSANRIFVANLGADNIGVYPVGKFGNVPSLVSYTHLTNPVGIVRDAAGNVYVANAAGDVITVYRQGTSGSRSPFAMIAGSKTGLRKPVGVALDSKGNIYVANTRGGASGEGSITIYPPHTNGDVGPTSAITGAATGLYRSGGIALDSVGNIYVTNQASQTGPASVTIYSAGSVGNVTPIRTLRGSNTRLTNPAGIAVDASGNIYVANEFSTGGVGNVEMFPPGSTGNFAPTTTIEGSCSDLENPAGVALDAAGNLYIANRGPVPDAPAVDITMYAAGSDGCVTPAAIICGSATRITQPAGLTLDSKLNIYVTDSLTNSVSVFAPPSALRDLVQRQASSQAPVPLVASVFKPPGGPSTSQGGTAKTASEGNVAPIETILSPHTSMDNPTAVALDKSGKIYVADEGSVRRDYDSITVYPGGSNANASPMAVIGPSASGLGGSTDITGLNGPDGIAVDSAGEIYVANEQVGSDGKGSITIYAPGSNGKVAPVRTIRGANTGVHNPGSLAIDAAGYLYVLNQWGGPHMRGSVTIYAPRSSGNVAPVRTISAAVNADQTGFVDPKGLAIDNSGNIYVTNAGSTDSFVSSEGITRYRPDSVTIYAAGSNGNVAPMAIISGPLTQLDSPTSIVMDSIGNIYIANAANRPRDADSITVYPPDSNGNVAPAMRLSNGAILRDAAIRGPLTGLDQPSALALGPAL
jgi:sugar lactone lactonase YvrE